MTKLVTIAMLIVTIKIANAEPPKQFKTYAEMQQARREVANAASDRFRAEQDIKEQAAKEKAAADIKARAEEKAHQKELREKAMLAEAAAPKVSVSVSVPLF